MAYKFEPAARLLLQLGDQLIRSESIAVLELIKNAYDANASKVTIQMSKIETPLQGTIVISDDGEGMTAAIVKSVWMQPGSMHKQKIAAKMKAGSKRRIPIGGKGIGRFGVHKLGYQITLYTRAAGQKEVRLIIDWKEFERDQKLDTIEVEITEATNPAHFKDKQTGTRIEIRELRAPWSRGTVRELYRAVTSLNSPFETQDSFKTYFKLDNQEWLEGLMKFNDLEGHALYFAEAEMEGNLIKRLSYEFRPWNVMDKLTPRTDVQSDIRMVRECRNEATKKKEQVDIDLGKFKIGKISFKLLIFDRSSKLLSLGLAEDKRGFLMYLNENGGVRVFRSGIRVYDYGEVGNDWLNLDLKRVNQPGKTISNNLIIGAIDLDIKASSDLQEKTNREGFIENAAYNEFVEAVDFTVDKILTLRNHDKDSVRKYYSPISVDEPVIGPIKALKEKISRRIKDEKVRTDLLKSITSIEKDYETITEIYARSSSAGLSLGIVIHEIIHMIAELSAAIKAKPVDAHISELIRSLERTTNDYASVIRQTKKSKNNVVKVIDQSLSNIQFRMKAHAIEILRSYDRPDTKDLSLPFAKNLVVSTIINILDNSIWWQNYGKIEKKKILIDIVDEPAGYFSILIADNGPGFSIPPSDATRPFISDKPGGMGLGLHLADEVMTAQRGRLSFPDASEYKLPKDFQKGAKLLLSFKKEL